MLRLSQCITVTVLLSMAVGLVVFPQTPALAAVCPTGGPTDMIDYWPLDASSGTTAVDTAGSKPGTLVGSPSWVAGQVGNALQFNGSNYVDTGSFTWGFSTTGTISAWIKTTASNQAVVNIARGTDQDELLMYVVGNKISLLNHISLTNYYGRQSLSDVNDGAWHHVVGVINGGGGPSSITLYVDGREDSGSTFTNGLQTDISDATPRLLRMGQRLGFNPSENYMGVLDELRIYDRTITATEAKNLYIADSGGCTLLSNVSDTLSNETTSAASNHTVTYTTSGGVSAGQSMTLTFPSGFDISAIDSGDVDVAYVSGGTTELTLGASPSGATWGISVTGQNLVIRSGTGTIPLGATVTIEVGLHATAGGIGDEQIINPPTTGTYLLTIGSTFGDVGDVNITIGTIDGSLVLSDSSIAATGAGYTFTLTPPAGVEFPDGGKMILTFPDAWDPSFDALTAGDVLVSGTNITGSTITFDDAGNHLIIVLDASAPVISTITIQVNNLTNPSSPGMYSIGFLAFDEMNDFLVKGIFYAGIGNALEATIMVAEALIMTLDSTAVVLQGDPTVNNGSDTSGSTVITIQSNAAGGYGLAASLDDGSGNNALSNGNGSTLPAVLPTNTSEAATIPADNYFGYKAQNGAGSPGTAENLFLALPTLLFSEPYAGSSTPTVGSTEVSNGTTYTVNYNLNVNFLVPAGVYTGTIYYTALVVF